MLISSDLSSIARTCKDYDSKFPDLEWVAWRSVMFCDEADQMVVSAKAGLSGIPVDPSPRGFSASVP